MKYFCLILLLVVALIPVNASAEDDQSFIGPYVGIGAGFGVGAQATNAEFEYKGFSFSTPSFSYPISGPDFELHAGWWWRVGSSVWRYGLEMNASYEGSSGEVDRSTYIVGLPVSYSLKTDLGPAVRFRIQAGRLIGRFTMIYAFTGVGAQHISMHGNAAFALWSYEGKVSGWSVSKNFGLGVTHMIGENIATSVEVSREILEGSLTRGFASVNSAIHMDRVILRLSYNF